MSTNSTNPSNPATGNPSQTQTDTNKNPQANNTTQQTQNTTTEKKETTQSAPVACKSRWYYWLFGSFAVVTALAGFAFIMKAKRHSN